ncbi:hypothetical protein BKA80DRAFT_147418 [Phyllosticta citrichinensis]
MESEQSLCCAVLCCAVLCCACGAEGGHVHQTLDQTDQTDQTERRTAVIGRISDHQTSSGGEHMHPARRPELSQAKNRRHLFLNTTPHSALGLSAPSLCLPKPTLHSTLLSRPLSRLPDPSSPSPPLLLPNPALPPPLGLFPASPNNDPTQGTQPGSPRTPLPLQQPRASPIPQTPSATKHNSRGRRRTYRARRRRGQQPNHQSPPRQREKAEKN